MSGRQLCDGFMHWWRRGDKFVCLITFIMVNVPSALFIAFEYEYVLSVTWFLFVIFAYLYLSSMSNLLSTVFSDPGYLPLCLDSVSPNSGVEGNDTNTAGTGDSYPFATELPQVALREVSIHGTLVRLKYCDTCKIFRPPRCSHCSICDKCVETHDHHCPWMSNCVGKRNYKFFVSFLFFTCCLCVFVIAVSISLLISHSIKFKLLLLDLLVNYPVVCFLVIFPFIALWSVGGLLGFHLFLIAKNLTTHEHMRLSFGPDPRMSSIFDMGSTWKNFIWFISRPLYQHHIPYQQSQSIPTTVIETV